MIRTTRNPMLGSASFWTENLSIIGFKTKTLSQLVSDMFKNNEQGFFYDPSSLTYGTYGVDQTSVGVPVTVGVADAAEYDGTSHIGSVYRADQYNQSIVNFDVDNTKSHELVIENTGSATIAVNADLAMGTVLFTVAAGQKVTRILNPVQVIVITSANDVSTAYFKIHSLKEFTGQYTMFQDTAGTVPVTGVGQPVGLLLDKSKSLTLGSEIISNGDFNTTDNWSNTGNVGIENGKLVFTNAISALSRQTINVVAGRTYKIVLGGYSTASGFLGVRVGAESIGVFFNGNGNFNAVYIAKTSGSVAFDIRCSTATTNASVEFVSVQELRGNHAYQATSASRPLLVVSPQRLDYDTVDDKLITTLPAQLTGCTVIRSVPNVGTQILTGQTIPTPYNDSTDHCGLIVINRALTTAETAQITQLFNKAAGV